VSGTSTIKIKEVIGKGVAFPSFTVTTFPWGFAFSDLVANVPDANGWKPVAQVENGQCVTLFWHGSVVEKGSYTIYYSDSQGQRTCKPKSLGQWLSPALYADTVFTLGVVTSNSVGEPLYASMSIAVAVRNPDLVAKSVKAQTAETGSATITNLDVLATTTLKGDLTVGSAASRPKLTVYSSLLSINAGGNGVITGDSLTFLAGTKSLVVDKASGLTVTAPLRVNGPLSVTGLSVTGPLTVTGLLSLTTSGLKMSDANAVIQRGDGNITAGDLGLYSNTKDKWMRFVTNNSIFRFYSDGGNGTNPTLTINSDGTLDVQGAPGTPPATLRLSNNIYTGTPGYNNNAEISNDVTKTYGALMLCGNSSRNFGKSPRWVQVWDNLEVKNDLFVTGWIYKYWNDTKRYEYLGGDGGYRWCEWHVPSDLRLKRDVEPVPSALDKVRHLRGVTFFWNEDALQHFTRNIETTLSAGPNATESESQKFWQAERDKRRNQLSTTQVGVLAQDVEAVLPEAVTTDADGYKTVRYDNLIPLLIEAVKEQDQLAARQQAEIERLKLAVGIGE
jgi:hypothetical protein